MDTGIIYKPAPLILPGFNGAMTSQPWIPRPVACPNAGVWQLQWSHDLSAMDTSGVVASSLSLSLLQWSHDLSAMDTNYVVAIEAMRLSFNGAMTSQPWIRSDYTVQSIKGLELQWSHDLSAMDTRPVAWPTASDM